MTFLIRDSYAIFCVRVHSFNGKTFLSKRKVRGSSPRGPAKKITSEATIFLQGSAILRPRKH